MTTWFDFEITDINVCPKLPETEIDKLIIFQKIITESKAEKE